MGKKNSEKRERGNDKGVGGTENTWEDENAEKGEQGWAGEGGGREEVC